MAVMNDPVMLIDQSLCVGCEACTTVCKTVYDVSEGIFRTKIDRKDTGTFPAVDSNYNKRACMHCKESACVMACPTNACQKTSDGFTVMDDRLCIGCNYCVANCPYGAISYDRSKNAIEKCTLCLPRIHEGLPPLCAETCTSRVIRFGERAEMLNLAEERVASLKDQGYAQARVYGETELGGLKVLSVLSNQPDRYGLPVEPHIPLGLRLWHKVPLTPAVLIAGGFVLGANFLHTRFVQKKRNAGQSEEEHLETGGDAS